MKLLFAIAIAALATILTAAPAPAASPEEGPIVRVELDLEASHGLRAQLETSDEEMVTLLLSRKGRFVSYEVKGQVTEAGLKVRFGQLGLIDVTFTPTNTLDSTEPSEGCAGAPRTLREGVFTGTIDFTGERGYVRIEGTQAEGSMSVISQWHCLEDPGPFAAVSRSHESNPEEESEHASLHALSRRCLCVFAAGRHHRDRRARQGRSIFFGAKVERRDGMEIYRQTVALGAPSDFVFNHEAGTATLRPPRPFSGRATFKRRPQGRNLWRSTIRVPLLGVDPLKPRGPSYRADLYPEYHFD